MGVFEDVLVEEGGVVCLSWEVMGLNKREDIAWVEGYFLVI